MDDFFEYPLLTHLSSYGKFLTVVFGVVSSVLELTFRNNVVAIYYLLGFMIADYFLGIMCAIKNRNLSSQKGYRGILKKFGILVVVTTCSFIDMYTKQILDLPVNVTFLGINVYIGNEIISIFENLAVLDVYIPKVIKDRISYVRKVADNGCEEK